MDYRQLGQTGLEVSALGFGCGAVGGILVKGDRDEMVQVVGRAIELGINYFDTAAIYGDGQSEANLGPILDELGAEVIVGTKVRLLADQLSNIEEAIFDSVEKSLRRLGRETVDLIQLHNSVATERRPDRNWVSVGDVEAAMEAFHKLQAQGKIGYWGINGLGETQAVHEALAGSTHTVQSCFNLINPSAGMPVPQGYPFQDFGQLIDRAAEQGKGVIAIRVLAAGALSGSTNRHANAAQSVAPIASGRNLAEDVALSRRFDFLVEEGVASTLVEAAIRFVIGKDAVSTTLVGISNMEQLEQAVESANNGPLPAEALHRLNEIWAGFG